MVRRWSAPNETGRAFFSPRGRDTESTATE